MTTGVIVGKRSRGKQRQNMMDGLTQWIKVGRVTETLKTTRERDSWEVMIAYSKEHGTWLINKCELTFIIVKKTIHSVINKT